MANLKVLFIGGSGRSGSTLLDSILGQLEGFESVGEFFEIWKAVVVENRRCGCGHLFWECAFWTSVKKASLGALDHADVANILRMQNNVCRWRRIPRMAWSSLQTPTFRRELLAYCDLVRRLLTCIRSRSGANVIVDSSKNPAHAYVLSMLDDIDLHIVQLVRDSRAVSYSWKRKKKIPDARAGDRYMVRMNLFQSAMDWNLHHFLLSTLRRARTRSVKSYSVIKYEEFVANPKLVLSRLVSPLDLNADVDALFESPSVVNRKRATHIIEGNPSKFLSGNIEVRGDDEWSRAMRPLDRAIVSVLTAPYLRKFGYV